MMFLHELKDCMMTLGKFLLLVGIILLLSASLVGCSNSRTLHSSTRLSLNATSNHNTSSEFIEYQAVLRTHGLFLDDQGSVNYQTEPNCAGVGHFDVLQSDSSHQLTVGDDEATGLVLPVQRVNSGWLLKNTDISIKRIFDSAWPKAPKQLRFELYGNWRTRDLDALVRIVKHSFPSSNVSWSVNRPDDIARIKNFLGNIDVGYHGDMTLTPENLKSVGFISVTPAMLELYGEQTLALASVELRFRNSSQFYQWTKLFPQHVSRISGTLGAIERYPFCAQRAGLTRNHVDSAEANPYEILPADTDFRKYSELKFLIPSRLYINLNGDIKPIRLLKQKESENTKAYPTLLGAPQKPIRIIINDNN